MDFGRVAAISGEMGIKDLNISWLEEECKKDEKYRALHAAVISGFGQFRKNMDLGQNPLNIFIFVNSDLIGTSFQLKEIWWY